MKKYTNTIITLTSILFFAGCTAQDIAKLNIDPDKQKRSQSYRSPTQTRANQIRGELHCLVVDESYNAQAHCINNTNSIRFYTTYREILANYKILHKQEISTNHTNTFALPNYKIAHLRVWITKK